MPHAKFARPSFFQLWAFLPTAGLLICSAPVSAQHHAYVGSTHESCDVRPVGPCDTLISPVPSADETPTPAEIPTVPDESIATDDGPALSDVVPPTASSASVAASFGAVAGAAGVPSMIGDFFAGNYNYVVIPGSSIGQGATVAVAGGDRQYKFAENNSPFPEDRVFFNYHHFHNAVIDIASNERNLDRYTFGLEKTFFDGWSSFEVRAPFMNSANSNPTAFVDNDLDDTEFGNVAVAVKTLLCRDACRAISVGLGIVFPTGQDYSVGGDVLFNRFENETVYFQPFVGVYHAPHDLVFTQFFVQFDFAANSNNVTIGSTSSDLTPQSLMMLDYSLGIWLLRNECATYIRGVAPMVEIHYTTTVEDQDYGAFQGRGVFIEDNRRDVLNITGGLYFRLGEMSSLKVGGVAPLRDGLDKAFDSEIGVQFVRRY